MPSPLGHALAGIASGWLVQGGAPERAKRPPDVIPVVVFASLGMAPDIDLLFGAHSGPTHGLGAALMAGLAAWALARWSGADRRVRFGIACACAYASHTLLDWLGTDTSPPIGIMALWPLSREHYESGFHVFMAVSRRYWRPAEFWGHNLLAVGRELVILVPLVAIMLTDWRRHRSRGSAAGTNSHRRTS